MVKNKRMIIFLSMGCLLLLFQKITWASEKNNEDNKNILTLTVASQKMAGIVVTVLQPKIITAFISAPGEVIPNANLSAKVTSRVTAQVKQRHVQEGEHVKVGQLLVTLSSVDMAKSQSELLLAAQDWERVKSLGKDAVSGKRFSEAQVAYQRAYSTVLAYGMTEAEVQELLRTQKPTRAKGEFNLLAPRNGTVFNINFTEGELIEPGRVLLQLVDEATIWVDAKLPTELAQPVKIGDPVRIISRGKTIMGRIIQVHHQLDETTRTRSVRVEAQNTDDFLHPGQFVNCQIEGKQTTPVLAVPIEAVVRTADGDWAVYVEKKPNEFQAVEVKIIETIDKQAVISGVSPGTRVVTQGAFFIHSEFNKKGFDAHGH
jgi:RND family efflux transporter MFP subunit